MARRRDGTRHVAEPATRPPVERELSAGGLVYRRRAGNVHVVLAARRRGNDGSFVWTIPKGHVEAGERMIDAALREVREETGLTATVDEPLGDVTYWYARRDAAGAPVRVFKRVRFYLMRHTGGRFADRDQEMDDVRWFVLAEAEATLGFENERVLVRRALELLFGA